MRIHGKTPFWFLLLFGLVFSGVGFGLIFAALYGGRYAQRQQRLQVEHPAEPWLWRADWAQGRANSTTRTSAIAGWVFAIFWNAVSMPIAFLVLPQALRQKSAGALVCMIFPAAGVYLLIRAIRQTMALAEFGNTYFEMSSVPGVVGRELNGQIQARFPPFARPWRPFAAFLCAPDADWIWQLAVHDREHPMAR